MEEEIRTLRRKISSLEKNNQMSIKMIGKLKKKEKEAKKAMIKNCRMIVEKNMIESKAKIGKIKASQKQQMKKMQDFIKKKDEKWQEKVNGISQELETWKEKAGTVGTVPTGDPEAERRLNEEISSLKTENEAIISERNEIREQYSGLEERIEEIQQLKTQLESRTNSLQSRIEEIETEKSSLENMNEKLKEQLESSNRQQSDLGELQLKYDDVQSKLDSVTASRDEILSSLEEVNKQVEELSSSKKKMKEEFEQYKSENEKKSTSEIEDLTREISKLKEDTENLTQERNEHSEKVGVLNGEKEKIEFEMRQLKDEIANLQTENETLTGKSGVLEEEIKRLVEQSDDASSNEEKISLLNQEIAALKIENEESATKLKTLRLDLENVKAEKEDIVSLKTSIKDEFDHYVEESKEKLSRVKDLENELHGLKNDHKVKESEFRVKSGGLNVTISERDSAISDLKNEIMKLKQEFQVEKSKIRRNVVSEKDEEWRKRMEELEKLKKEETELQLSSLRKKIENVKERELEEVRKKLKRTEDDFEEFKKSREQQTKDRVQEAINLEEAKQREGMKEIEGEVRKLEKNLITLKSEYETKINSIHQKHDEAILEAEKTMHRKFHDRFKDRRKKLVERSQNQVRRFNERLENLTDTKETLKMENQEFQKSIIQLQTDNARYEEDNKSLKERYSKLDEDYKRLSSSNLMDEKQIAEQTKLKISNEYLTDRVSKLEKEMEEWKKKYDDQGKELHELKMKESALKKSVPKKKIEFKTPTRMSQTLRPNSVPSSFRRDQLKKNKKRRMIQLDMNDDEDEGPPPGEEDEENEGEEEEKPKETDEIKKEEDPKIEKEKKPEDKVIEENVEEKKKPKLPKKPMSAIPASRLAMIKKGRRKTISMDMGGMNSTMRPSKKRDLSSLFNNPAKSEEPKIEEEQAKNEDDDEKKKTSKPLPDIPKKSEEKKTKSKRKKKSRDPFEMKKKRNTMAFSTLAGGDRKLLQKRFEEMRTNKKSSDVQEVGEDQQEYLKELFSFSPEEEERIKKEYEGINHKFDRMNKRHYNIASAHHFKNRSASRNLPLNHSLVALKKNRYICASKVSLNGINYILTQWPIKNVVLDTSTDFWRMVSRSYPIPKVIVALQETKKVQREMYWPMPGQTIKHGKLRINCKNIAYGPDFDVYDIVTYKKSMKHFKKKKRFSLRLRKKKKKKKGSEGTDGGDEEEKKYKQRDMKLIMYKKKWPLKGVPEDPVSFENLITRVQDEYMTEHVQIEGDKQDDGRRSIVVHGVVGVGRTGTFCLVHNILCNRRDLDTSHINESLCELRKNCRVGLVESAEQYKYLYHLVKDKKGT